MLIGDKLRGLRVEKGLTINQMADKLSMSEPTYRKFETNKSSPDILTIDKIAKILEKNFLDLLPSECFVQTNIEQKGGVVVNLGTINNCDKDDHIETLKKEIEFLKKLLDK